MKNLSAAPRCLCYLLCALFLFCACSTDRNEPGVTPPGVDGEGVDGEPVTLTFTLQTNSMETAVVGDDNGTLTRATRADIDDEGLHNLWLLLYDENGKLLESCYSMAVTLIEEKLWSVEVNLYTPLGTECKVYAFANTHDEDLFHARNTSKFATLDLLREMVYTIDTQKPETMWQVNEKIGIPMRGVGRTSKGETTLDTAPELIRLGHNMYINLHFLLSRITFDLTNNLNDIADIYGVWLENVPATYSYIKDAEALKTSGYTYINYPLIDVANGVISPITWYVPRHLMASHAEVDKEKTTRIGATVYSHEKEEYRWFCFYPHTSSGDEASPVYNFNLDGGQAIHYKATINSTRLALLETGKHWHVDKPGMLRSDANSMIVRSDKMAEMPDGYWFDINPQVNKYGSYLATGSLAASDVKEEHATRVIPADAAWTAEVVWQTASNLIEIRKNTRIRQTGPKRLVNFTLSEENIQGNALIAVKNQNGDIVWSWHLWILNHDPGTTAYTPNNTDVPIREYTLLNYNLGATENTWGGAGLSSYGLYYQWGRKDPFPNTGDPGGAANDYFVGDKQYTIPATYQPTDINNLAYSVARPDVFITGHELDESWRGSTATNTIEEGDISWGGSSGSSIRNDYLTGKTVFDPCPSGYRVPPSAVFGNELENAENKASGKFNKGYDWTTISGGYNGSTTGPGIFPAAGERGAGSGIVDTYGSSGNYWSASRGGNTISLGIGSETVGLGNYDHGGGYSVRCIRE